MLWHILSSGLVSMSIFKHKLKIQSENTKCIIARSDYSWAVDNLKNTLNNKMSGVKTSIRR